MTANVERLDEAIQEVVARGFDIRLQIDNSGYCEFSILGNKTGSMQTVSCNPRDGDTAASSVPMRIIEELLLLDGKV